MLVGLVPLMKLEPVGSTLSCVEHTSLSWFNTHFFRFFLVIFLQPLNTLRSNQKKVVPTCSAQQTLKALKMALFGRVSFGYRRIHNEEERGMILIPKCDCSEGDLSDVLIGEMYRMFVENQKYVCLYNSTNET